jgi:hypothetical protein
MAFRLVTLSVLASFASGHGGGGQDFSGAMLIKDKVHLKSVASEAVSEGGALFVRYMMRG